MFRWPTEKSVSVHLCLIPLCSFLIAAPIWDAYPSSNQHNRPTFAYDNEQPTPNQHEAFHCATADDYGTEFVVINAGKNNLKRKFAIHRNLICPASLQVTTTFNELIGKPEVLEIILCDENPTIFQAFYDWLYSGQVREASNITGSFLRRYIG